MKSPKKTIFASGEVGSWQSFIVTHWISRKPNRKLAHLINNRVDVGNLWLESKALIVGGRKRKLSYNINLSEHCNK